MTFALMALIISTFAALLAIFFQLISQKNDMNEKWICLLRDSVSDYLGNCENYRLFLKGIKKKEEIDEGTIITMLAKIKLLLNPKSKRDVPLLKACTDLQSILENNKTSEYLNQEKVLIAASQDLLHGCWSGIKTRNNINIYGSVVILLGLLIIAFKSREQEESKMQIEILPKSEVSIKGFEVSPCNSHEINKQHIDTTKTGNKPLSKIIEER